MTIRRHKVPSVFGRPLDHPESSTAKVERLAAEVPVPTYAIDDQTAIKVVSGADAAGSVEIIPEGHWTLLTGKQGIRPA